MAADDPFAPPSIDPADEGSLSGLLRSFARKMIEDLDDCMPAKVLAVSADRQYATIEPQIMILSTDGTRTARAQLPRVPIFNMGAGNFVLSFPVTPGDFGWIKATDRDVSLYLQDLAAGVPNTRRQHSFSDGFFIPDVMRQWVLASEDAERVVLQTLDGTCRIALGNEVIKLTAPDVEIVSASLLHNGVNVGATHKHTGGTISGDTGPPLP